MIYLKGKYEFVILILNKDFEKEKILEIEKIRLVIYIFLRIN